MAGSLMPRPSQQPTGIVCELSDPKAHGFAKEVATWDALLSLGLYEHNWLRPHVALRIPSPEPCDGRHYQQPTPAMALGLTSHLWSWHEFLTFRM